MHDFDLTWRHRLRVALAAVALIGAFALGVGAGHASIDTRPPCAKMSP